MDESYDSTDHGIENYMNGNIVKYIMKEANKEDNPYPRYATLESHLEDYTYCVNGVRGRQKKSLSNNIRIDATLFNTDYKPIYAIEVKRKWNNNQCENDICRLYDLVHRYGRYQAEGSSLYAGIFLCIYSQFFDSIEDYCIEKLEKEYAKKVNTVIRNKNGFTLNFAKDFNVNPFTYNFENENGEEKYNMFHLYP